MSEPQFDKRHFVTEEFEIEVTDEVYSKIKKELHYASGDDYGLMQNVGIVIVDFLSMLGIKIRNPWQRGWNCSEFVCILMKKSHPELVKDIDPQTVTPKQIYKLLKSVN